MGLRFGEIEDFGKVALSEGFDVSSIVLHVYLAERLSL